MLETTDPEINVVELMRRVRQLAHVTAADPDSAADDLSRRLAALPTFPPLPSLPTIPRDPASAPNDRRVTPNASAPMNDLLARAREKTEVGAAVPGFLRPLRRNQGGFNGILLETVRHLTEMNLALQGQVQNLSEQIVAQHAWIEAAAPWAEALQTLVGGLTNHVAGQNRAVHAGRSEVAALRELVQAGAVETGRLQREWPRWQARVEDLAAGQATVVTRCAKLERDHEDESKNSRAQWGDGKARLDALHGDIMRAGEHLRNLQGQADHLRAALDAEIHAREDLGATTVGILPTLDGLRRDFGRLDERQVADGSFLKAELSLLRRAAAPAAGSPSAAPLSPVASNAPGDDGHSLDAFYVAFENEFRGSRNLVQERLRVYLPDLEVVGAGNGPERSVLDLGCGRGEWLELLRENGRAAVRGVDLNLAMVEECRARGLDVQAADALGFLRGLPDDSLGAVTAFHLIEHLPFRTLLDLLAEAHRVLRPGGVAVLESPNCKNLVVGACNFYSDPTHRNPVFPDTADFMLRSQGFARTELRYLRPVEKGSPFDPTRPDGATLQDWFFGPRDFAVIGHKADGGQGDGWRPGGQGAA